GPISFVGSTSAVGSTMALGCMGMVSAFFPAHMKGPAVPGGSTDDSLHPRQPDVCYHEAPGIVPAEAQQVHRHAPAIHAVVIEVDDQLARKAAVPRFRAGGKLLPQGVFWKHAHAHLRPGLIVRHLA